MQESGIEKDDLQTMFNVLDSDDSGEVHVFFFCRKIVEEEKWNFCVIYFLCLVFLFLCWIGREGGGVGGWDDYGLVHMVSFLQQRVRGMLSIAHAERRNKQLNVFFFQNRLDGRHA